MHGYPVMQFLQYSMPPPSASCNWMPQNHHRTGRDAGYSISARGRPGMVVKKYVIWCLVCGGFSCVLGLLFMGVYFLLHSYTITVGNFETIPTFVPATLLILTGLCVMSLARRRNRYSYLIKLSGACGLISALTCALVTVTTTVLHMSRLQALRECEYAQKTRTCTCYSDMIESQVDRVDKEGVRLVFDSLSDCGVVHGSLYSCLRAIFGLSVAGVLIAVFSCMLVYQLLSHERKKMYWEQLELRCRSLYTRPQMQPQNMAGVPGQHGCRCCEQCHAHRQVAISANAYPHWDESSEPRFWSTQPPGNFYSPNPESEDIAALTGTCRGHSEMTTQRSRGSGWSWNRWWQRSSPDPNSRFRQTPSSPDSDTQYGFSNNTAIQLNAIPEDAVNPDQYRVMPNNLPYGVWGPPPPYSDPNSPARRGYYQYIQPPHGMSNINSTAQNNPSMMNIQPMGHAESSHGQFMDQNAAMQANCCQQQPASIIVGQQRTNASAISNAGSLKSKVDYQNTPSDSDCNSSVRDRDRFSNTLPTRKIKKRLDPGNKSIGPNSNSSQRINIQQIFSQNCEVNEQEYHEPKDLEDDSNVLAMQNGKTGVENSAFQNSSESTNVVQSGGCEQQSQECGSSDPTESEVYFADVSSCCNMSVKNDHFYEDTRASQRTLTGSADQQQQHRPKHQHFHQHQLSNCSSNASTNNEDYLAQRFGQRENSTRSRLPFPQTNEFLDSTQAHKATNAVDCVASQQSMTHGIPKDTSRQSMCSMDSAKTEFTDLSPSTPCGNKLNTHLLQPAVGQNISNNATPTNFVPSYPPFSSESQSLEAHRRSTKNLTEAHYEIIDDQQAPRPTNLKVKTPIKPMRKENGKRVPGDWSDTSNQNERHRL